MGMSFRDLREFLARLEDVGELVRIESEVEPKYDLAGFCHRMLEKRGPALYFENVSGSAIPVVAELFATRSRFAEALQTTVADVHTEWVKRLSQPRKPRMVERKEAPCKEVILRDADVDLSLLPVPTWNELDGGPYISFALTITRDAATGQRNVGVYRIQVHEKNVGGIMAAPYRHIMQHRRGTNGPLAVAVVIGADPATIIAGAAPFPYGIDEMEMAGGLGGQAIPMVPCESVPLEVPAESEIVLEGIIPEDELRDEGPYGEFTGYYGNRAPRPIIRFECMTMRRNPVFLATHHGMPPQDAHMLQSIPAEAEILRTVPLHGIRDVVLTEAGCGSFHAVASVEKEVEGYGKMAGLAILGSWAGRYIKQLTVVGADIDPKNRDMVEWAVATRVQPHRDIEIMNNLIGVILDPSLPESERASGHSRTSKVILDATGYGEGSPAPMPCRPPDETLRKVDAVWEKVIPVDKSGLRLTSSNKSGET